MREIILPEIVGVGIYNSQMNGHNVKISKNRKTTMFELELPLDEGGVSYINSESMPITPDMLICAKPGQTRHTRFPFKCYYVHMILKDGYLYDAFCRMPNFIKTERSDVYRKIFSRMCRYYDTAIDRDKMILQSLLLELIYTMEKESELYPKIEKSKNGNQLVIEKVLRYIKDNLTDDLSLERVASEASLSPIHFHNCFKKAVGKTLHEYVNEQRISKAVNMLITTDKNLTEIAFESGFSSQSYFSYVFKRRMNATPREYAKMINDRYDI